MNTGLAILAATLLVLATMNVGFRRFLVYAIVAGIALAIMLLVLATYGAYHATIAAAAVVGGLIVAWFFRRRQEALKEGGLILERYKQHLPKILATKSLTPAFNDLLKRPSLQRAVEFDQLLEEELRKEADFDRQHPGFGIYLKAVGASLAEDDADLQSLGAETLEELLNCPEALSRNPTRSIDRHLEFLKRSRRPEEEILFVTKEVLLPWQRDGISPSQTGCQIHGKRT
jgi:hypothetical protein